MTVWREVQEALYERWRVEWAAATPYFFADETEPELSGYWCRVRVQHRPGQQETLGPKRKRKWARNGVVFISVRGPTGTGVGDRSDLAQQARDVFEGCGFSPHNIQFNEGDIGDDFEIEGGREREVLVECPFSYEEIR